MRTYIFLIYIAMFISCSQTDNPPEFSSNQVEIEVRNMLDNYFEAIQKGGLTAEFEYLDQSADFFWVPPGYASALSYDSVRTILEANASGYQSINFEWKSLDVYPLDNDHATYTGIVTGQMIDTAQVTVDVALIESGVIIKRKDGWKLLCGQSAVLPD